MNRQEYFQKKFSMIALVGLLLVLLAGASSASLPSPLDKNGLLACETCRENASIDQNDYGISNVTDPVLALNAKDGLLNLERSSELSARVAPVAATLNSPSGVLTRGNPTYNWNEAANTLYYCLEVKNILGNVVFRQWYDSAEPVTPSLVLAPGDYSWQIQTWNCDGSSWSLINEFTICTPKSFPGKATLVSPRLTIGTSKPTYIWNPVAGSTEYRLKVVNINNPNYPVIDQWNDSVEVLSDSRCSIKPDVALPAGTYKWWIQTRNCKGDGQWSNYMSFKFANILPGKATPISPRGLISTSNPTFIWTAVQGATQYNLQVENDSSNIIDNWYDAEDVTSGMRCQALLLAALPDDDSVYYWRIRASNDAGNGSWSSYRYFETVCSSEMALAKAKVQKADGFADRVKVKIPRDKSQQSCSACKARAH